jgi:hypothetical protein
LYLLCNITWYIFSSIVVTTMVFFSVVLPPIAAPYSSVCVQDQETNWHGSFVLFTLETSGTWHAEGCKVLHLVYITTSQVLISLADFSSEKFVQSLIYSWSQYELQCSNEFWDLYKGYLDPKIREGNMKICFYGAVSERDITKTFSLAE